MTPEQIEAAAIKLCEIWGKAPHLCPDLDCPSTKYIDIAMREIKRHLDAAEAIRQVLSS